MNVEAGANAQHPEPVSIRHQSAAIAVAIVVVLLVGKIIFITRYGSSLPFWDQWGGESGRLYKPILEGNFQWSALWAAHNEHRIFFTRVLAIGLFYANQFQWDPTVQVLANVLIECVAVGCALRWLQRRLDFPAFVLLSGCALIAVLVPNGWDNTLVGFQNCFYFFVLFSVLAIGLAARTRADFRGAVWLASLVGCSFFSLATGLVTALAVLCVLTLRTLFGELSARRAALVAIGPALIFAVGLLTTPHVDAHQVLRAADLREFLAGWALAASWPSPTPWGLLQWIPALFMLVTGLRGRRWKPTDMVFAGLALWTLLVGASIAYARGHGLSGIESRYTDVLVIGVISNAFIFFRIVGECAFARGKAREWLLVAGVLALVFLAVDSEWQNRSIGLAERSGRMEVAASNVSRYIAGDRTAIVNRPFMYIPTTPAEAEGLASVLMDPSVLSVLPFSLLPLQENPGKDSRVCKWVGDDKEVSAHGRLECGLGKRSEQPGARFVSVGPLSAMAFALWTFASTDWKAPVKLQATSPLPVDQGSMIPGALGCSFERLNDETAAAGEHFRAHYAAAMKLEGWSGPRSMTDPITVVLRAGDGKVFSVAH